MPGGHYAHAKGRLAATGKRAIGSRLREALVSYPDLERRLDALERKSDAQFKVVFDAIRALMMSESGPPRPIGFRPDEE